MGVGGDLDAVPVATPHRKFKTPAANANAAAFMPSVLLSRRRQGFVKEDDSTEEEQERHAQQEQLHAHLSLSRRRG